MYISKNKINEYLTDTIESIKDSFSRGLYYICEEESTELVGLTWFLWKIGALNEGEREQYLEIAYHFKNLSFSLK